MVSCFAHDHTVGRCLGVAIGEPDAVARFADAKRPADLVCMAQLEICQGRLWTDAVRTRACARVRVDAVVLYRQVCRKRGSGAICV